MLGELDGPFLAFTEPKGAWLSCLRRETQAEELGEGYEWLFGTLGTLLHIYMTICVFLFSFVACFNVSLSWTHSFLCRPIRL